MTRINDPIQQYELQRHVHHLAVDCGERHGGVPEKLNNERFTCMTQGLLGMFMRLSQG
ncbi:MAG: hypothetical protein LJE85_07720 [Gammaproteobacteria bacterium]|nr:hypothetical protein [Gammaproteobacteria bacterium]